MDIKQKIYSFQKSRQLARAIRSNAAIISVIGPIGSGKTSAGFIKSLLTALQQQPNHNNVRNVMCLAVRNTYKMLQSTVETARDTFSGLPYTLKGSPYPELSIKCDLGDGTTLDYTVQFMAFDKPEDKKKVLGLAISHAIVDEAGELDQDLILSINSRVGRYPNKLSGSECTNPYMYLATNGPRLENWLYKYKIGECDDIIHAMSRKLGRPYFELIEQPPALLRPPRQKDFDKIDLWKPNPLAENIENLKGGYNYYYKVLSDNIKSGAEGERKIHSWIEGQFASLKEGDLVFSEFSRELHIISQHDFEPGIGSSFGLSFDFGNTPVCHLWCVTGAGRFVIIDEWMMERASVDDLLSEQVMPALYDKYSNIKISWGTGDPSGLQHGQGLYISPVNVITIDYDLPFEVVDKSNRIEPRLDALHTLLKRLDCKGHPRFGITSNCVQTIDALARTYVYEKTKKTHGNNPIYKETPVKDHINWRSDLADSVCYGALFLIESRGDIRETVSFPKERERYMFC